MFSVMIQNIYIYIKKQARLRILKHLENGLMMFTTKENCTVTVKDYLYIYIYKKQKNKQNTADKCIKSTMYPDSHTRILHNHSVLSYSDVAI